MDLTQSFRRFLPSEVVQRFEIREVRNAAGVLASIAPDEWQEIVEVLSDIQLRPDDILGAGGNKSLLAERIDSAFRQKGWREGRVDTSIKLTVTVSSWPTGGRANVQATEVNNRGYKVDNLKGRVALDVEWNAKDGNLDRDIGAYRAMYDAGVIDAGVIITRTQDDMRQLALSLDPSTSKFSTTTTTNLEKLQPRLTRGDGGGCPILAVAISSKCYTPH
ncbi:MAG: restriction endonuclease [Actinobacteria bacterium]|jgi:hypothetical protein|nr:restriction endonuclease [Actinomycetota bacterium]